ncbi:hypothetical protein LO80_02250 [Candidatus Francisella endociliophora]|uniref:Frag1/DRAM/Sfk1 family protein n=1 Tax=Candidatus Francisella endociliophora TaxID=653937 RepID=A0A097EMW6_9GAMM|nr:hypothetical protein [Francisella sp. FSC1006]AIT08914.1 hypothetical protein LO80_02250 [Francisella sp. FSC1006]
MKNKPNIYVNVKVIIYFMIIVTPIAMMLSYYWAEYEGHLIRPFTNGPIFCTDEQIAKYSYTYSAFIAGCSSVSATMRYFPESFILHTVFTVDSILIGFTFYFFKHWIINLNKLNNNYFKRIKLHSTVVMFLGFFGSICFLISTSMWSGKHVYDIYLGPINIGDWHAILAYTFCSSILISAIYFTIVEFRLRKRISLPLGYKICFSIRLLSFSLFISIFIIVILDAIINKKLQIGNAGLEYWMIYIFIFWYSSFIFDKKFYEHLDN